MRCVDCSLNQFEDSLGECFEFSLDCAAVQFLEQVLVVVWVLAPEVFVTPVVIKILYHQICELD